MTYKEKLKDRRWSKRRREILIRDNFTCQKCGYKSHKNHVHHVVYEKGFEPWEYPDEYLLTLCKDCHEHEHRLIDLFNEYIKEMKLHGIMMKEIILKFNINN